MQTYAYALPLTAGLAICLDKVLILAGHPWIYFRSLLLWCSQEGETAIPTYVFNFWDTLFPPLPNAETFSICLILGRSQVAILGLTMKYLLSSNLPRAIWNHRALGLYHFNKNGPRNWSVNGKRKREGRSPWFEGLADQGAWIIST